MLCGKLSHMFCSACIIGFCFFVENIKGLVDKELMNHDFARQIQTEISPFFAGCYSIHKCLWSEKVTNSQPLTQQLYTAGRCVQEL